ncbi:MAG: hypothetical protein GY839_16845 [candidate division Zixibacteria bacterium]|nr:hypothetical protein [candidate division Zixibacteria bacterium]
MNSWLTHRVTNLFGVSLVLILILFSQGYCEYRNGDANGDGWFNIGDVAHLMCYLNGSCPLLNCFEGADANGDMIVTGLDVPYMVNSLQGFNPGPIGICTTLAVPCEDYSQKVIMWFGNPEVNGATVTVPAFVTGSTVPELVTFHAAFQYDPNILTNLSANVQPGNGFATYTWDRPNIPTPGQNIVSISYMATNGCTGLNFSGDTHIFDLTFDVIPPSGEYDLCVYHDDPTMGPPRFHFTNCSDDCIPASCRVMIAGDANGDGRVIGSDVTFMVNFFRGAGPSPVGYYCCCIPIRW